MTVKWISSMHQPTCVFCQLFSFMLDKKVYSFWFRFPFEIPNPTIDFALISKISFTAYYRKYVVATAYLL